MAPLEPATRPARSPTSRYAAGIACLVLGLAAIATATVLVIRRGVLFDEMPDWRVIVPLWVAAAIAAVVSTVRREGNYGLAVAGLALASGALALGWVLALAAVAVVTLVVIYGLSEAL